MSKYMDITYLAGRNGWFRDYDKIFLRYDEKEDNVILACIETNRNLNYDEDKNACLIDRVFMYNDGQEDWSNVQDVRDISEDFREFIVYDFDGDVTDRHETYSLESALEIISMGDNAIEDLEGYWL